MPPLPRDYGRQARPLVRVLICPNANRLLRKNREDGVSARHWQGIHDDKGRIMIAIAHNSDVSDTRP
jgi:hypothetical protein